jgi:hypothetical protein
MVDYLLGYFIDCEGPLLLNVAESTLDGTVFSEVVPEYVPGRKLTDIPIYILASSTTASAAEAFICHMKYFNGNVTIIGQKTRGAENPVDHIAIDSRFVLQIPTWKKLYSANPNTWEGVGICPDVEVDPGQALKAAHLSALGRLSEISDDEISIEKYQWAIDGLSAGDDQADGDIIRKYAGDYGVVNIFYKDRQLFYRFKEKPPIRLIPVANDYFIVKGVDYFRVRFIENDGGLTLKRIFVSGIEKDYPKKQ